MGYIEYTYYSVPFRQFGKTDSQHQHGPSDMTSRASDLMPGKRQMKPFHPLNYNNIIIINTFYVKSIVLEADL